MSNVRREGDKYRLVGLGNELLLPANYESLRLEKIGSQSRIIDRTYGGSEIYSLFRIVAGNRYGLVLDEEVWELGSRSRVMLEPIYGNLLVTKTDDETYTVKADGNSGRIRFGKWIDSLMPDDERKRLEEQRMNREKERKRLRNEGAPRREQAERERQQEIQAKRRASGCCIMCGYPLGLVRRIFGKARHQVCVKFSENSPGDREAFLAKINLQTGSGR